MADYSQQTHETLALLVHQFLGAVEEYFPTAKHGTGKKQKFRLAMITELMVDKRCQNLDPLAPMNQVPTIYLYEDERTGLKKFISAVNNENREPGDLGRSIFSTDFSYSSWRLIYSNSTASIVQARKNEQI
jgi:hypothetical protein